MLNGEYEIIYGNGDRLFGIFHCGLLSKGETNIIIRNEKNCEGENIHKHLSIINSELFCQPCKYTGEIRNGQLCGRGSLTYINNSTLQSIYENHIHIYSEIRNILANPMSIDVIWHKNNIKKRLKC